MNRTIKVYPEFADFFGMEETSTDRGVFRHAARGRGTQEGPFLLGRSAAANPRAERLKQLMERAGLRAQGRQGDQPGL